LGSLGVRDLVMPLAGDALRIEHMFDGVNATDISRSLAVSIPRWNDAYSGTDPDTYV
jgi:hypothetical protein